MSICVYVIILLYSFLGLYTRVCARVRACVGVLGLVFSYARARVGIFFGFSFFCG